MEDLEDWQHALWIHWLLLIILLGDMVSDINMVSSDK